MTNDTRSPEEIEREIESQRSDLTSNLEDLQDKLSIDTIVRQIGDQFREHGGDMSRSISDQVKANPIPLALTGIGLAWMMFGNAQKESAPARISDYRDDDRPSDVENDYRRTLEAQGQPYAGPTSNAPKHRSGPSWSHDDGDDGPSLTDRMSDGAAHGAASFKGIASSAAASVSDAASAAGAKVSNAASSAKPSAKGAKQSMKSGLATAGSRIAEGTENLTEEGRQRVVAARQKAVDWQRQTARTTREGADAAADFYDRQPLVVGALALAVGAALGGALPRTKTEDDLLGATSDSLFNEAELIFEEEKAKALNVAKLVKDEVTDIASEVKKDLDSGAPGDKTAAQAVADKAKSTTARLANATKTTAKDKKLGKPKT